MLNQLFTDRDSVRRNLQRQLAIERQVDHVSFCFVKWMEFDLFRASRKFTPLLWVAGITLKARLTQRWVLKVALIMVVMETMKVFVVWLTLSSQITLKDLQECWKRELAEAVRADIEEFHAIIRLLPGTCSPSYREGDGYVSHRYEPIVQSWLLFAL